MLLIRKDKPNTQTHHVHVNNDRIFVSVIDNLDQFENYFFAFLEQVKKMYGQSYQLFVNSPPGHTTIDICTALNSMMRLIYIFYETVDTFMYQSVIIWPKEINDEYLLRRLNSIVFARSVQMHLRLSSIITSVEGGWAPDQMPTTLRRIYATKNLLDHIEAFNNSGFEKQSEPLLDSLWKIKHQVAKVAYPEPSLYKWDFDYEKDNWRKLVELQKQYPDQTYMKYVDSLGQTQKSAS